MTETPEARLKRLRMRSMRRGIREMDLILHRFAEARLATMPEADLGLYDALLSENDHVLYQWVPGQSNPPERYAVLVRAIAADLPEPGA